MPLKQGLAAGLGFALVFAGSTARGAGEETKSGEWPRYARTLGADRYSPLAQINTGNVKQLAEAWRYRLRPDGGAGLLGGTVPIVVDGRMYLPLGNAIVALEPETGREIWRHPVPEGSARRWVSYWPGDGVDGARLYYSVGAKIVALEAATGRPAASFGDKGAIALDPPFAYPPTVYKNVLIAGATVQEMQSGPPGDTRAFDARTGKALWTFHTVPRPGEVGHETWLSDGWKNRSGTNMWVWYNAIDPATDTLYMTIGGPSANYDGSDRPGANLFGNSLVAVDALTGKYKWHFQTIHHDLWDSDLPAPPVLFDARIKGRSVPALSLTGKTGFMYILDRRTGKPLFGVDEKPVAKGDVPGEWYSPTQPIPRLPEELSRHHWTPDDVVTAADTNAEHAAACRALLQTYGGTFFNRGAFTPFNLHRPGDPIRGSINLPNNGGSNWGGSAADPTRGVIYINTSEGGTIGWVEERDAKGDYGRGTSGSTQKYDRGSHSGPGAYQTFSASFTNAQGQKVTLPCIRPPWGRLLAIDGNTGKTLWQTRLGISEDLAPEKQLTGSNNTFGGPIVTAGGLVFIGATQDRRFRAFSARTGKLVWEQALDYAALTVPITYRGRDGRQYVAIMAAGSFLATPPKAPDGKPKNEEALYVWALPKGAK